MTPLVNNWLMARNLTTVAESGVFGGYCDLVGYEPDEDKMLERIKDRQKTPISSYLSHAILSMLRDVDWATTNAIYSEFRDYYDESEIRSQLRQLSSRRMILLGKDSVSLAAKWYPMHKRIVAVELKLNRITECFEQAVANGLVATESYVAFPKDVADRIADNSRKYAKYLDKGIGLLTVTPNDCKILIGATPSFLSGLPVIQGQVSEKLWRYYISRKRT